jgi:hypothetical protein
VKDEQIQSQHHSDENTKRDPMYRMNFQESLSRCKKNKRYENIRWSRMINDGTQSFCQKLQK